MESMVLKPERHWSDIVVTFLCRNNICIWTDGIPSLEKVECHDSNQLSTVSPVAMCELETSHSTCSGDCAQQTLKELPTLLPPFCY